MTTQSLPRIAAKRDSAAAPPVSDTMIYTCPMHPEVQQDHPGNCPKCGMTLEPMTVKAGADEESKTPSCAT
jgi:Cu+-exporting ATPase